MIPGISRKDAKEQSRTGEWVYKGAGYLHKAPNGSFYIMYQHAKAPVIVQGLPWEV